MSNFWDTYYKKPLEQIPWQHTQADWFKELVDTKQFFGNDILDLGCGTGIKSIYLATHRDTQHITGVDISAEAILYANQHAQDANVTDLCTFRQADVRKWEFTSAENQFDAILDWATIHTLTRDQLEHYAQNIFRHLTPGGLFLVRAFTSDDARTEFVEMIDGVSTTILLLSKKEIQNLFATFTLVAEHESRPRTHADKHFIELLFKK